MQETTTTTVKRSTFPPNYCRHCIASSFQLTFNCINLVAGAVQWYAWKIKELHRSTQHQPNCTWINIENFISLYFMFTFFHNTVLYSGSNLILIDLFYILHIIFFCSLLTSTTTITAMVGDDNKYLGGLPIVNNRLHTPLHHVHQTSIARDSPSMNQGSSTVIIIAHIQVIAATTGLEFSTSL